MVLTEKVQEPFSDVHRRTRPDSRKSAIDGDDRGTGTTMDTVIPAAPAEACGQADAAGSSRRSRDRPLLELLQSGGSSGVEKRSAVASKSRCLAAGICIWNEQMQAIQKSQDATR